MATRFELNRRRTGWDIALGVLLVIGGIAILGNTVVATVLSILFVGWVTVAAGVVSLLAGFFRVGRPGFWPAVLSGGLLVGLGCMLLRYPLAGALTFTLMAGMLFLVSGIARVAGSFEFVSLRWILLIGGLISMALGLVVLLNIWVATLSLLGTLLGIEVLLDGITIMLIGRVTVEAIAPPRVPAIRHAENRS